MLQTDATTANNSSDSEIIQEEQKYITVGIKRVRKVKVAKMSDITEIFDGQIRIFRTTNSGDVYQLRMWIKEEKKYIRESLRTRDKIVALKLAEDKFIEYKSRVRNGEKLFSLSAEEFREKYLEYVQTRVDNKQISVGRQTNIRTFTKHYLDFVGKSSKIQNIDKHKFNEYLSFRRSKKADITNTVVVNELISINQMYDWGKRKGLIAQNYTLEYEKIKVRKDEVKREGISVKDYLTIGRSSGRWYERVKKNEPLSEEQIYYRKSIRDFIILMAHFGFRTGELRLLKYGDVIVHEDDTATVTIKQETTKVRNKRVVRGRRGDIFARRKEYSKFIDDEDYVFSHFRKRDVITKELLYDYFNQLKKYTKNLHPDFDESVDIYDLRHLWITIQLTIGKIDVYTISKYAGTSIAQIQNHYDHVQDTHVSNKVLSYNYELNKDIESQIVLVNLTDKELKEKRLQAKIDRSKNR